MTATTNGKDLRRCPGVRTDGSACDTPGQMLLDSGFCWTHDPDVTDGERKAAQQRGGMRQARKARKGLDPSELPELNSPEAAATWAATISLAIATGELPADQGRVALHGVALWLKAHSEGQVADRLKRLEQRLMKGRS